LFTIITSATPLFSVYPDYPKTAKIQLAPHGGSTIAPNLTARDLGTIAGQKPNPNNHHLSIGSL
jgi:hypothetical protein